jgi:hypothetical protein
MSKPAHHCCMWMYQSSIPFERMGRFWQHREDRRQRWGTTQEPHSLSSSGNKNRLLLWGNWIVAGIFGWESLVMLGNGTMATRKVYQLIGKLRADNFRSAVCV